MGMISTTNYVARKYGVRAAMPGFIGKKLCPQLVFVKSHFEKYTVVAEQIRSIIQEYDPDLTSHSLDEVYMDLTDAATMYVKNQRNKEHEMESNNSLHSCSTSSSSTSSSASSTTATATLPLPPPPPHPYIYSSSSSCDISNDLEVEVEDDDCDINNTHAQTTPNTTPHTTTTTTSTSTTSLPIPLPLLRQAACIILEQIRHKIQVVTGGLTCSAGIANNFFLAKICADVNKPNGQFELPGNRQGECLFFCDCNRFIFIYIVAFDGVVTVVIIGIVVTIYIIIIVTIIIVISLFVVL
jgi:DNA polymerase kappa